MGSGTHPFACADEQEVSPKDRYHALDEEMQWTARRLLICGTHFHVGVPSGRHAVAVLNELLRHLPLLQILSASRPDFERSEEHPSELPSLMRFSYAVFCLQH